ncbi:response regulator transcription factor [Hydrogenimonas urashimensis]|uniref:response regulator transcription factor n=1 Tax=Hydrogenimonas urashimensis TaxID=2740515 RepID=UPI001915193D|nr:response regulator transcription factor [Hydrogenimonas urashimensis]
MHLLIVEDEKSVANQLKALLEQEKYRCDVAYDYKEAMGYCDEKRYDLILLDWNLPDGSGLTLLKELRDMEIATPVLMLSAKSEVDDRVTVLDAGGDDYLCKPYSNIELLARIRALLRREAPQKRTVLESGPLSLDTKSKEVKVNNETVTLSPTEFDLLELLLRNKNIVLTRYQLNEHLCREYSSLKQSNILDVHIKNIRKKTGLKNLIVTVRGIGYTIKE